MLLPPPDLDMATLLEMLGKQFGTCGNPEFLPLGEDSWCYRLDELWISIRRDLRGHDPRAYNAVYQLRLAGLDFVLAPSPGLDGDIVHTVQGRPVVVFPYVAAEPLDRTADRKPYFGKVVELLRRIHDCDPGVALPTEDYRLPYDKVLDRVLESVDAGGPETGPFSQRLHRLVMTHRARIEGKRERLAQLAESCAASAGRPVLTHGEPRAQNILRHGSGLLFADWGDARWGPPERDWFHVLATLGTAPPCRPDFLLFYKLRWDLDEIAEYAGRFLGDHVGDAEDQAMWGRLSQYLPGG